MAIEPAAISASPAVTTTAVVAMLGPRQAGRQGERHGQAVGHADHDVADELAGGEVALDVGGLMHRVSW